MARSETLTIAITDDVIQVNHNICQLLSYLCQKQCSKIKIDIVLFITNTDLDVLSLTNLLSKNVLQANKIIITPTIKVGVIGNNLNIDVFFTSDSELADVALTNTLPVVKLDITPSYRIISETLTFAFDGDAVLFSNSAQLIADNHGVEAFDEHEQRFARRILDKGPLFELIRKINVLQQLRDDIRWVLITARGGRAFARAMNTMQHWKLSPSQYFFLEGSDKTPILTAISSDIFFDDHEGHCNRARSHTIVGHVQVK